MTSNVGTDSLPVEQPNDGRNKREGSPLKKGPWTEEEDTILKSYVAMYGQGKWSYVHRRTGLPRCGKSCRLRWTNHLKPGLKKGFFTPEEEALIIELQAKIGNKWVQIAAEIPGRTDNDIKNFWNARLKKQQRRKKYLDPLDVCFDEFSEDNQNKELAASSSTNSDSAVLPINKNIEIPTMEFNNFEPSPQLYPPGLLDIDFVSSFLDIPETSLLDQGLNSSWIHPSKSMLGSESSDQNQYRNMTSGYHLSFPNNIPLYGNSSSESIWEHKQVLPSRQTPMETWSLPSSVPSLESSYTDFCSLSPQSSGLLDAIPKASFNNSHQENSRFDSCPILQEIQWGTNIDAISPSGPCFTGEPPVNNTFNR